MGRVVLGFAAAIGLMIPIVMSPGPANAQQGQGQGPDWKDVAVGGGPPGGFANNDCRGDLESTLHTGDGATGDNGGGNNNDRGRQFDPDLIAGSPNNPHVFFGNNNGKCVTRQ